MDTFEVLRTNLASPITLAFALGVVSRLIRSELSLPRDLYTSLGIYLLLALGLKGGVELAHSSFTVIFWPAMVTLLLGCFTPVSSYLVLRRLGKFSAVDAAGIAAHYGSVSAVTFMAAQQFVEAMGVPAEGFLPTLLTLLESPGIHIALAIGIIQGSRAGGADPTASGAAGAKAVETRALGSQLHEVLTARSMVLLVGGLVAGYLMGPQGYASVAPFFEGMFKGALTLFQLEMGITAGARLSDLRQAGLFLVAFGVAMPALHGALAVLLGHWAGLSVGGCTVLATMAASASYIAAPPAVRMTLPQANPTYYLTAALAITLPFNLLAGIPLYYYLARLVAGG
ncbi:MAG: sodium-dependent bicarbonate transport family permease [Pirellulaceae bacterium]